jgi:hypothetical protein
MSRNDEFIADFGKDPVDAMGKITKWRTEKPIPPRDPMKGKHKNWQNRKGRVGGTNSGN